MSYAVKMNLVLGISETQEKGPPSSALPAVHRAPAGLHWRDTWDTAASGFLQKAPGPSSVLERFSVR